MKRNSSVKTKNPQGSFGSLEAAALTLKDCAQMANGKDLRILIIDVLLSQIQMLNYIRSTGIPTKLLSPLYNELCRLALLVLDMSDKSLEYLRTFLADEVELRIAIEMATNLAKQDANKDK